MSVSATTTDINNYDTDYDDLLDLDTAAMIKVFEDMDQHEHDGLVSMAELDA